MCCKMFLPHSLHYFSNCFILCYLSITSFTLTSSSLSYHPSFLSFITSASFSVFSSKYPHLTVQYLPPVHHYSSYIFSLLFSNHTIVWSPPPTLLFILSVSPTSSTLCYSLLHRLHICSVRLQWNNTCVHRTGHSRHEAQQLLEQRDKDTRGATITWRNIKTSCRSHAKVLVILSYMAF